MKENRMRLYEPPVLKRFSQKLLRGHLLVRVSFCAGQLPVKSSNTELHLMILKLLSAKTCPRLPEEMFNPFTTVVTVLHQKRDYKICDDMKHSIYLATLVSGTCE